MRWVYGCLLTIGVLAIASLWRKFRRDRKATIGTYLDFAKDPKRSEHVRELFGQEDAAIRRAATLPPERLVSLLSGDAACMAISKAIELKGRACLPALVAAIDKPEFREIYSEQQRDAMGMFGDDATPLEAVLKCLHEMPDENCVANVSTLVNDPNRSVRQAAAFVLGTVAADSCREPLTTSLSDADEHVRTWAMMGLEYATTAGRGTAELRSHLFDLVLPFAIGHDVGGQVSRCLLNLNRERAATILTDARFCSVANPQLSRILGALRDAKVSIPEGPMLAIIEQAEKDPTNYPNHSLIEDGLVVLSLRPTQAVRDAVKRNESSASPKVRVGAARAMLMIEGVSDPWKVAFASLPRGDLDKVASPIRHALLCRFWIDQVQNGGISQWFVNGYGKEWKRTLEAFDAVGSTGDRQILTWALSKFGSGAPPADDMDNAVAELHQKNDDPWTNPPGSFADDDLEALVLRYILTNREHFTQRTDPRR